MHLYSDVCIDAELLCVNVDDVVDVIVVVVTAAAIVVVVASSVACRLVFVPVSYTHLTLPTKA